MHSDEYKLLKAEEMKGNTYALGHKHSEETLKQISKSLTGKKHSPEAKLKMAESRRLYWENKHKEKQMED